MCLGVIYLPSFSPRTHEILTKAAFAENECDEGKRDWEEKQG